MHLEFFFDNGERRWSDVEIKAGGGQYGQAPWAYMETEGYVCISAARYDRKEDIQGMGWRIVPRLGRMCDAIKSFPVVKNWAEEEKRPYVEYRFVVRRSGRHRMRLYLSPRNPMIKGGTIKGAYGISGGDVVMFDAVSQGFYAEWRDSEWSYGVTNNIRIVEESIELQEGLNTLQFYAVDPNLILENIVIFREDMPVRDTHLAPPESSRVGWPGKR